MSLRSEEDIYSIEHTHNCHREIEVVHISLRYTFGGLGQSDELLDPFLPLLYCSSTLLLSVELVVDYHIQKLC